ncbi:MAG: DUF6485 family protein [Desulfobacterota bacterium]|nr:DUF6485 family protein [Thermodesulfobacteriota bacterium]
MECTVEKNLSTCPCTYMSCSKRGKCCECVRYHTGRGELPGCFFPPDVERTYDRSRAMFIKTYAQKNR